jgi:mannose-6-phosphate isomerase-like protein (cupin superfamily)
MQEKPFDITRWDSPQAPSQDFLERLLTREGLKPERQEFVGKTHTPEMKFDQAVVWALISGQLQVSFPGYGVIALKPGDMLEVQSGVLHDLIVVSEKSAQLLEAFRQ